MTTQAGFGPSRGTADAALVGTAVDLAPWTYVWRADRPVQQQPEAYFIPRRLERLDRVYRTARQVLPEDQLKSIYYDMPDLLKPLPPPPAGPLLVGLLWTGALAEFEVELCWPPGVETPSPDAVEVRSYPTSFGWFGWTVDRVLAPPRVSADGRTWTFTSGPREKMDSAYNVKVDAATEMIAVFGPRRPGSSEAVPEVRLTSAGVGAWQRAEVEIEWGFAAPTSGREVRGRLEPCVAMVGPIRPLPEDEGTSVVNGSGWVSRPTDRGRRGILVPMLHAPDARPGLDSRITLWLDGAAFTVRLGDLDQGPILTARHGVFLRHAGRGPAAQPFAAELSGRQLRSVRQLTREHREAASWEELMRQVRLWTCPADTELRPFPAVPEPRMQVELPDPGWTAAWRAASHQLTGEHMWGGLAFEVGRVAHEMNLIGLHAEADKVYDHFLKSPGAKPDGDYADGEGALEWATSMRHDMGYSHDGTHASTGRLLFAMAERYFLTGDADWFRRHRDRLQAAADWIIRQRTHYLREAPNRAELFAAGLMPPGMLGDYAIPACDWHWYYVDNALSVQGLRRFADALMELDPDAGWRYDREAKSFQQDLRRVVEREAALAPVRLGRDGLYHSFIPRMAYARGLTGVELGAPQFPECDVWVGALPLAEPFVGWSATDARMVDTLDVMEEMGTSPGRVQAQEQALREKGLPTTDAWFWLPYTSLPKASHTANAYLLQDDVSGFLRYWMNAYASMVGADGRLWEHWHLGGYTECEAPDNGTAGWFLENFRDLLVMEEGQALWVARATPRAWLAHGSRIRVSGSPTYFGDLAYELVSDVDHGRIHATVHIPDRKPPESVLLRLRHPQASALQSVTVDGRPWSRFDPDREVIHLSGLAGRVAVVAAYR